MLLRNQLLYLSGKSEETPRIPIVFGNYILSIDNFIVEHVGDILKLSEDGGNTFTKTLNIEGYGVITSMHVFETGELLFSTPTQVFYSLDWIDIQESLVLDINGNPFVPVSEEDNFRTLFASSNRQIVGGVEIICWGNYRITGSGVYIWHTSNKGQTIKCSILFGTTVDSTGYLLRCRHVHNVDFNPYDSSFWVQTGDEPVGTNSHWIKGFYSSETDNFIWTRVGTGQSFKTTTMTFKGEYVYWAWDISQGGVMRCKYSEISDNTKHEMLFKTPNDCLSVTVGPRGDILAVITTYGGVESPKKLYYSEDGLEWHTIIGQMPPVGYEHRGAIYAQQWRVNSNGKILSGILAHVSDMPLWGKKPSVWLDDMIRNAGFPNAFRP